MGIGHDMQLHHLGFACQDIEKAIKQIKHLYHIISVGDILFDPQQDIQVCLIKVKDSVNLELVSGEPVKNFYKKNINLYHTCYEVEDIDAELEKFRAQGAIQISEIIPAKLFNGRSVVFLQTELGIVELLQKEKFEFRLNVEKIKLISTFSIEEISWSLLKLSQKMNLSLEIENCSNLLFVLLDNTRSKNNDQTIIIFRFSDLHKWAVGDNKKANLGQRANSFLKSIKKHFKASDKVFVILTDSLNTKKSKRLEAIEKQFINDLSNYYGNNFINFSTIKRYIF